MSGTLAPKIEIYTRLVCRVHRPDLFKDTYHYDPATTEGILGKPRPADGILDPHDTFPHPDTRETILHFAADEGEEGLTKPTCASDPLVQRIVAQLAAGMLHAPYIHTRLMNHHSYDPLYGRPCLSHHWLVGIGTPATRFPCLMTLT